ncbi:MAG TPA: hypothetical protein VE715_00315 [Blastocatellia bacterium]|nr:hypothetical protein [Blastocatellia bacterium]
MDGLTMKAALVIGALLLIGLLWLVWKFFAKVFKHVVIMLVLTVAGVTFFYFRYRSFSPPPPPPYIGKHAYMKESGEYIGVVENQAEDSRRGKVWIIRPLGSSHSMRYAQSRVTLKDKMELKPAPPPPSPESKPASDKVDKKVDNNKKKN